MILKTFPVSGAAYRSNKTLAERKTHFCFVNNAGVPVQVLCPNVKLENILADTTQATNKLPTCKACLRRCGIKR